MTSLVSLPPLLVPLVWPPLAPAEWGSTWPCANSGGWERMLDGWVWRFLGVGMGVKGGGGEIELTAGSDALVWGAVFFETVVFCKKGWC